MTLPKILSEPALEIDNPYLRLSRSPRLVLKKQNISLILIFLSVTLSSRNRRLHGVNLNVKFVTRPFHQLHYLRSQEIHPEETPAEHRCHHYEKVFETAKALKQQVDRSHERKGQSKLLRCLWVGCSETFRGNYNLDRYIKSKHAGLISQEPN